MGAVRAATSTSQILVGPSVSLRGIVVALADGVRTTLNDVDSLDIQVEPRFVLTPTPLTIDVYPGAVARDGESAAFDDVSGGYLLTVRARINTPDYDAAYDILLSLMDDDDDLCLALAVMDDTSLGGLSTDVDARDQTGLQVYDALDGEGGYLGFQLTALVLPAHS